MGLLRRDLPQQNQGYWGLLDHVEPVARPVHHLASYTLHAWCQLEWKRPLLRLRRMYFCVCFVRVLLPPGNQRKNTGGYGRDIRHALQGRLTRPDDVPADCGRTSQSSYWSLVTGDFALRF